MRFFKLIFIYTFVFNTSTYAQDLLDDLTVSATLGDSSQIFSEKIINIGRSKKIFILTNTNSMLNKGDFITLIVNDKDAAARALVAKKHNSLVGIKILKIYSIKNWSQIYKGMDIKILKGDDSILFVKEKKKEDIVQDTTRILGEEDLYAEELALEDSFEGDFAKDNRLIKPDNIVSLAYGQFRFKDSKTTGDVLGGSEFTGGWAYQFRDNFWVEALGTLLTINDYPDNGDQTVITRLTGRLKYTYKLPFYSYLMPYIGYQLNLVSSPNATTAEEDKNVKDLALGKIAVGATLLRRLVPGWFLKVDVGTDLISIGAAIEF